MSIENRIAEIETIYQQENNILPKKPWQRELVKPGQYIFEGMGAPEPGEYDKWLANCERVIEIDSLTKSTGQE